MIRRRCAWPGQRSIVWLQDVLSVGIRHVVRRKLPVVGELVARRFTRLERANLRAADGIICITEDFLPILESWGIPRTRCRVIENWAPLDEITPLATDNPWAREHGLTGRKVVLYSGTLGLKHNPAGIAALARAFADRPDVVFVVVSEGPGAAWLGEAKRQGGLDNLLLLPFQPYARFSEVLAAASVVLAVIEPDAGVFSVPSKVLSYLSAGRAILLAVPPENLAARTVRRAGAGLVVAPGDQAGLEHALGRLLDDDPQREAMGRHGRRHAERAFAIGTIADSFEAFCRPPSASATERTLAAA
jgi:glycosyltransferase involved in cell wall biosynthesis